MEGDLQRTQMSLTSRDEEIQSLLEQIQEVRCQLGDRENKTALLQRELDHLTHSLARTEGTESHFKDRVQTLSQALSSATAGTSSLQENISQLQKALTAAEQDRRLLQVGKPSCSKQSVILAYISQLSILLSKLQQNCVVQISPIPILGICYKSPAFFEKKKLCSKVFK